LRTLTTHIFAADSEYLLRDGIPDDDWGLLERPLYLMQR
jgi:hypothetical protein